MIRAQDIPQVVRDVAGVLLRNNYDAYLVGGCVRDMFLNKTPKDWDITTNAHPTVIQELFLDSFSNNDYGTVGVVTSSEQENLKVIEITPYRTESAYSDARRPDSVQFGVSLLEDLARRDFTINAIALHAETLEIVDPYKGREDLLAGRIMAVREPEERFQEDALRMMRAVRLASELGFVIEAHTMAAIARVAPNLARISKERIRDELSRILLSGSPMQGIIFLEKLGLLPHIIPELSEGIGIAQNQAHAFDVYEHLLRAMQHAADKNYSFLLRLTALMHDIGKPATRRFSPEKGDWTFYGHEVIGARMTKKILADLRYPSDIAEPATNLVRWHMFFSDPAQITLSAVRRTIRNVGQEHIEDLLNLRICDRIGTGRPKEQPFRFRMYKSMVDEALRDPITVQMLTIDGARVMDLSGEKPGPRIGHVLHALLEEVLDDPTRNTYETLETRALELLRGDPEILKALGEQGKDRREAEDEAVIRDLRSKHHVR